MKHEKHQSIDAFLQEISQLRKTAFDRHLKPVGITRSQWWVLHAIQTYGSKPVTQRELADHLDVGKAALGSLLDQLEHRRYITRRADENDRRVNRVHMTNKGEKILNYVQELIFVLNDKVMRGISAHGRSILLIALEQMKLNLLS
jgi:MarR family transcriptional regulator, transcriptional regulator for hemolysin